MTSNTEKEPVPRYVPDKKDLAILKLLQENARMTVREIAQQVHLSSTPVHERIKRLEESGIITQYATLVDASSVNKALMVICHVSLKVHGRKAGGKFVKTIQQLPEVVECYSISGEFDFFLKVVCADMNAFYDFHVHTLSEIENMGHVKSIFVMGVIKDTHQLIF